MKDLCSLSEESESLEYMTYISDVGFMGET